MKRQFWVLVCLLGVFFGCTADRSNPLGQASSAVSTTPLPAPNVTWTASPSTRQLAGKTITFTYAIAPGSGAAAAPTGLVSFYDQTSNNQPIGSPITVSATKTGTTFDYNNELFGGTHTFCSSYVGDQNNAAKTVCFDYEIVYPPSTSTSLFLSSTTTSKGANPSIYGEDILVQYNVSQSLRQCDGLPCQVPSIDGVMHLSYFDGGPVTAGGTGNVPLRDDCPVTGGMGQCYVSGIPVGSNWYIQGDFVPNDPFAYAESTGYAGSIEIEAANTTTKITQSGSPTIVDHEIAFVVDVTPDTPSNRRGPTGPVWIYLDGDEAPAAGPVNLTPDDANGASSVTIKTTNPALVHSVGIRNVHAVYQSDDGNFNGSSSPVGSPDGYQHTVELDGTIRTLTSNPTAWTYGDNITFTLSVASAGAGATPTGSVSFYDGDPKDPSRFLASDSLHPNGTMPFASFSTASLSLGQHTIVAVYGGDTQHSAGNATLTQTVTKAKPNISILLSTDKSGKAIFSEPVTFGATITGNGALAPMGTVHFYDDGNGFGSDLNVAGGAVSFIDVARPVGTNKTIKVVFTPDPTDTHYDTAEATTTLTVDPAPTAIALSTSNDPAAVTTIVTFTATVTTSPPATATPSGSVTFRDGEIPLATKSLSGGVASFSTSTLALGMHSITATFDGAPNWLGNSKSLPQTIQTAAVTSSIGSSLNPSNVGDSVTFTASFGTEAAGPATGSVEFFDGPTTLGTQTITAGSAALTTSALGYGPHVIRAVYGGDPTHSASNASLSQIVNRRPTTTTLTTTAASSTAFGVAVPLTATVTAPSGSPDGYVTFKDGATVLGQTTLDAAGVAKFTPIALGVGSHSFTAVYSGGLAVSPSTSAAVAHTVTKIASTLSLISSSNPSPVGFNVSFTATIGGGTLPIGPTGTITFRDGTTTLGSGVVSAGGIATFATSGLLAGSHSITASYAGDAQYAPVDSAVVNQVVSANAAAISLTSSPNPSIIGTPVTISVSLGGALGIPTGSITFKQGGTTIGTGTLDATGKATMTTSTLPVGTLTLTADYAGDVKYNAGQASVAHIVKKIATTTKLTASSSAAFLSAPITFTVSVSTGTGPASGDVELFDATTSVGVATLSGSGQATFTISNLTAGAHAITAVYKGTATFAESRSNTLSETIASTTGEGGGLDAGSDGGDINGSSGGSSGGSSSSSGAPPGAGSSSSGAVGASSGLNINPGNGNNGGDDCAMTPGGTGTVTVPLLIGLVAVLARRRRKVAA